MFFSVSRFSGLSKPSTVPAGSLAKASSVGAKTVKGPALLRVSTSAAAWTAVTNVVKRPSAIAVSTMSLAAGTAVGGTAVAIGAAAGVPHAANTIEANNKTNSELMCRRFTLAPFHGDEHFAEKGNLSLSFCENDNYKINCRE